MNQRWLVLAGVLAFAVTLAVLVGNRLATTGALSVALGVALGVLVGVPSGVAAALFLLRKQGSTLAGLGAPPEEMTSVVMPREQAELLIKILGSRKQADPSAFPMVAERERQFSAVAGAQLDDDYNGG